jgi:hypothetical protein
MRRIIPHKSPVRNRFRLLASVTLIFCCLCGFALSLQSPLGQVLAHANMGFFGSHNSALMLKTHQRRNSSTRVNTTPQATTTVAQAGTTVAQTSTAVTQTSVTATATPVVSSSSSSSGAMPTGDLPGWHQIFADDFNSNVSTGGFPGSSYSNHFTVYPDGTADTAGQHGEHSNYYPSKVVSVNNGVLSEYVHSENGTRMTAALQPILPGNHLYGKYSVRFRADAVAGFRAAWLLWPDSEVWPHDGEIDFPESDLVDKIGGFVHRQDATAVNDQDAFSTDATYTSWHTASIEWTPGKVRVILDGVVVGESTTRVPNTPMHWVLQTEGSRDSGPYSAGNVQIDWAVAYSMA